MAVEFVLEVEIRTVFDSWTAAGWISVREADLDIRILINVIWLVESDRDLMTLRSSDYCVINCAFGANIYACSGQVSAWWVFNDWVRSDQLAFVVRVTDEILVANRDNHTIARLVWIDGDQKWRRYRYRVEITSQIEGDCLQARRQSMVAVLGRGKAQFKVKGGRFCPRLPSGHK